MLRIAPTVVASRLYDLGCPARCPSELNNQSSCLSGPGRREQALAAIEKAVTAYRERPVPAPTPPLPPGRPRRVGPRGLAGRPSRRGDHLPGPLRRLRRWRPDAATWQEMADGRWQGPRPSMLDPFKPHLRQRTGQGCGNAAQLFREISALGYTGSYSTVRHWLDQHRPAPAALPPPPPTVRQVTGWLTRHPDSLTEDDKTQLKAPLDRCPELQAASDQVRAFAAMLTQLTGHQLPRWISDTRAAGLPGLSSFAKGLEQDLDAVTWGLTSRWNSGPVESRVNHIKMIKRQMFGRATFPLLRKRVLLTARAG